MYSEKDKKDSKKGRFSSEYTMLSILEYLYVNSRKTAVSKYNIVTNTPGIRQQRADRVNLMMVSLENNGYIISEYTSSNITFYKITKKGGDRESVKSSTDCLSTFPSTILIITAPYSFRTLLRLLPSLSLLLSSFR
jgi:hypothetical protein